MLHETEPKPADARTCVRLPAPRFGPHIRALFFGTRDPVFAPDHLQPVFRPASSPLLWILSYRAAIPHAALTQSFLQSPAGLRRHVSNTPKHSLTLTRAFPLLAPSNNSEGLNVVTQEDLVLPHLGPISPYFASKQRISANKAISIQGFCHKPETIMHRMIGIRIRIYAEIILRYVAPGSLGFHANPKALRPMRSCLFR